MYMTLCEKRGSAIVGIAINNWPVKNPSPIAGGLVLPSGGNKGALWDAIVEMWLVSRCTARLSVRSVISLLAAAARIRQAAWAFAPIGPGF